MNLNKVILIGRLTQDPDSRSIPSGQNVTTIKIATNRVWKDPSGQRKEATEYHVVIAWGRLSDIAAQYLKKGGLVMIEGRLQTRNWTDQSGVKKYITEIIAENLQLGPRTMGTQGAGGFASRNEPSTGVKNYQSQDPVESRPNLSGQMPIKDSDIPIIDENEPMHSGIEEDEMKIKEEDLPF